ncbi:hypothetical protein Tco_0881404 [Tanacetum coccineum]|uniref:Uncharacterized protein n=1 Tax=Tanacetum coccineum TaxID=301880 RepID=A0ABQ5BJ20_9ASTR
MADVNVNAPAEQAPAMAPPTRTDQSNPASHQMGAYRKKQLLFGYSLGHRHPRPDNDYAAGGCGRIHANPIHTFNEYKKNLAHHTMERRKPNPYCDPECAREPNGKSWDPLAKILLLDDIRGFGVDREDADRRKVVEKKSLKELHSARQGPSSIRWLRSQGKNLNLEKFQPRLIIYLFNGRIRLDRAKG